MALVTHLLDVKEEQVPGWYLSGGIAAHGPGVDQRGVDHHQADDRAQEDVAAEHAGGGDGHQHRQQREGGVGHQVQEGEPVAVTKGGPELRDGFDDTHHQAGGHDGGQDRDEHVAGGLQDLLPQGHLAGRRGLDVGLGGGGSAGDGQEFVVDLVDGAGADDQLQLTVGFEHALDAVDVLQGCLVDLAVVGDDQPQSGCAMGRADDVGSSADIGSDLFSAFPIVQCHRFLSPSSKFRDLCALPVESAHKSPINHHFTITRHKCKVESAFCLGFVKYIKI